MKIIELLNKIANGEEIKAKLKFKLGDIIITYYGTNNYYKTPEYNIEYIDKGCTTHDFNLGMIIKHLNNEVEIIEEEPKVQVELTEKEYLEYLDKQIEYMEKVKNYKPNPSYLSPKEEKKIPEKLTDILRVDDLIPPVDENMYKIWEQTIKNQNKINEICDYLKSKGE